MVSTQVIAALGSTTAAVKEERAAFTAYQLMQQLGAAAGYALPLVIPLESSNAQLWVQVRRLRCARS